MAKPFDAYHEWLGIAPRDQPPNHYRLLGIDVFESNPNVIDSAADRQMTHLRSFQSGARAEVCEALLNRVSAARGLLLDPQRKATYDGKLRQAMATAAPEAPPLRAAEPVESAGIVTTHSPARRRSKSPWVALGVFGLLVSAAVAAAAAIYLLKSDSPTDDQLATTGDSVAEPADDEDKANAQDASSEKGVSAKDDSANPGSDDDPIAKVPANVKDPADATGKNAPDDASKTDPAGNNATDPDLNGEAVDQKDPSDPPSKPDPSKPDRSKPKQPRPPIPGAAIQKKAEVQIREIFDLNKPLTDQRKAVMVRDLLKTVPETLDDPVAQYVMLRMTIEMAAQLGDYANAEKAILEMSQRFEVDAIAIRSDTIIRMLDAKLPANLRLRVVREGLRAVEACYAADRYERASAILTAVLREASRLRNKQITDDARQLRDQGRPLAKRYEAVRPAFEQLETSPDDPAANTIAGKYICYIKGDWDRGLAMLAKGDDRTLRDLAQREQRGSDDAQQHLAIADGWWKVAAAEPREAGDAVRKHAADWYRQALPNLTGLKRVKVQKLLAKAGGNPSEEPIAAGGVAADLNQAEERAVGIYHGLATSKKGKVKKSKSATFELRPDRTIRGAGGRQLGKWQMTGSLLQLAFNELETGPSKLRKNSRTGWTTVEPDVAGLVWTWRVAPVRLVATWEITETRTRSRRLIKLYSNGRAMSPYDETTWRLSGSRLSISFRSEPANWTLGRDRRTLSGRWLRGAYVTGRLVGPQ